MFTYLILVGKNFILPHGKKTRCRPCFNTLICLHNIQTVSAISPFLPPWKTHPLERRRMSKATCICIGLSAKNKFLPSITKMIITCWYWLNHLEISRLESSRDQSIGATVVVQWSSTAVEVKLRKAKKLIIKDFVFRSQNKNCFDNLILRKSKMCFRVKSSEN